MKFLIMLTSILSSMQFAYANTNQECKVITDFNDSKQNLAWLIVNDTVMGGRSSSNVKFENQKMVFEGEINTNGGGFASLRFPLDIGLLSQYSTIQLKLKPDTRPYKLTFISDARYRGRRVSFQGDIPQTPIGVFKKVRLDLDGLQASLFGRKLHGVKFNKDNVFTMGVILSDGTDGPFKLVVESIMACKKVVDLAELKPSND